MNLYNNLFGVNNSAEMLLKILNINRFEIERFRDIFFDKESSFVVIHARTGGGNREDYPNVILIENKYYSHDKDADFDSTYANFYFKLPEDITKELKEIFKNDDTPLPNQKWDLIFKYLEAQENKDKS